jgi:hypothetical protein
MFRKDSELVTHSKNKKIEKVAKTRQILLSSTKYSSPTRVTDSV